MKSEEIEDLSIDLAYHIVQHDSGQVSDPEELNQIIKKYLDSYFSI